MKLTTIIENIFILAIFMIFSPEFSFASELATPVYKLNYYFQYFLLTLFLKV